MAFPAMNLLTQKKYDWIRVMVVQPDSLLWELSNAAVSTQANVSLRSAY